MGFVDVKNKKRGITLMVLVITIILILILSSAIIITVSHISPIKEANESVLRTDIQTMKDSYQILYNDLLYKNLGNEYKIKDSDFEKIILDKYKNEFVAGKDGIDYVGDDERVKEIAKEMGLGQKETKIEVDVTLVADVTSIEIEAILVPDNTNIDEYIYYIREKGKEEWEIHKSPDNKIKIDNLKENTKYEVKVEVVENENKTESDIKEITTNKLEAGKLIMKLNDRDGKSYIEGTWTKENVYIEVDGNKTIYTATGANTVNKTSTPSTLTNEGITNIIVETKDGESVITKEYKVMIDKEPPSGQLEKQVIPKGPFNGDVVISIKDPTDNLSGVKEYEYYINGEPRAVSKDNKYIFENLDKGKYEIKVVIVDNANNKKELITNVVVGVPDANDEEKVQVRKEPTKWTNGNVTLTVTFTAESMYIPQYSEDKKTWIDVDKTYVKQIETNKSVYVRYRHEDIPNFGGLEREIVIDNIDKELPVINSVVSNNTQSINQDITITGKAIDTLSGIVAFQFSTDGSLTATSGGWTTIENTKEEISKDYTITGNGTYYFYVKDEAENVAKKEIEINNIDKIKPTVSLEPNGGTYVIPVGSIQTNISAKLSANDEGTSNLRILQYQFSREENAPSDDDVNWKDFTNGQTITESIGGGKYYLYTKVVDGAGNRAEQIKKSNEYIVNYQIKYDANNGEGAPEEQFKVHDTSLTLSNIKPTRTGYTFTGWSTNKDALQPEYSSSGQYNTNSSTVLYAVWEINKYNVTYNYSENGGSSATKTKDIITYLQQIDLSPTATKENYNFVGWNTNKDATEALTTLTMGAGDVTLYAIYRKPIVGTFYYYDGSQETSKTEIGYMYNNLTTAIIATPVIQNVLKDGVTYSPRGWSTSNTADAAINVIGGNNITVTGDTTYYASYSQTITAVFHYNTNKTATSSATRYMNYLGEYIQNNITVPEVVSSSSGPSSTTYSHVSTSKDGEAVIPTTEVLTYYTVYKKTVTATKYVYNNSSSKVNATAYGYYDGTTKNASINLGTTSASGYTFRGWSTSSAANASISVAANGTVSLLNNTTYYASYTQSVTVTFYYYSNKSTTASGTRYMNYAGTYVGNNLTLPSVVESSTGPSGTTFSHIATTKTGDAVAPTTTTTTYYAVYRKTVTVTKYYYNNRSSTASGAAWGYYDGTTKNASINLGTTSVNGYTFRGWSTSSAANASISVAANGSASVINNTTYYASYSYAVYIYYNLNGGSGSVPATSGTAYMNYTGTKIGASVSVTTRTPSRTNYSFSGWYTTYNGGTKVTGSRTLTASMTLYAHWEDDRDAWFVIETQAGDNKRGITLYTKSYYSQVVFPVWSSNNGQDDIEWLNTTRGTWSGGYTYTAWVYQSNHNYEGGIYNVHAYPGSSSGATGSIIAGTEFNWESYSGSEGGGGGVVTPPPVVSHTCNTDNYCTTVHNSGTSWACTCGGTHTQHRHPMCSICGKKSPVSWWKCPYSPEGNPVACQ